MEVTVKNSDICQKFKYLPKIEIFVKNFKIGEKSKYL